MPWRPPMRSECPICGHLGWCELNTAGTIIFCHRRGLFIPARQPAGPVLVCYGLDNTEAALSLGVAVVGIPSGARRGIAVAYYVCSLCPPKRDVWIVPDSDMPGRKGASELSRGLTAMSIAHRILNLKPTNDLREWVDTGGTAEELKKISECSLPIGGSGVRPIGGQTCSVSKQS